MKKVTILVISLLFFSACSKNDADQKNTVVSAPKATTKRVAQGGITPQASTQPKKNIYVSYTIPQAKQLIEQRKDLVIVDVRSPQELKEGKIKNSILVPFWNIMKSQHQLPRDRPLLLVCAVGGRSYAAMQILARQGYSELYNLKGGISAWKNAKMPVVY